MSGSFELLGISDCPKSKKKQQRLLEEKASYIFEHLLHKKETILNDKEIVWWAHTPTTKSSKSGSTEKPTPFWNAECAEASRKLWLPRDTDCVASSTNGLEQNSWFSAERMIHRSPPQRHFLAKETVAEDVDVIKMRKVKLNPTTTQKALLKKFNDGARYSYNEAVGRVNADTSALNKLRLRNQIVTEKDNPFFDNKKWLLETPNAIREQAVFEACKNFKSAFSNRKAGNIEKFKMGFKTKRNRCFTLGVKKYIGVKKVENEKDVLSILPRFLGQIRYYGKLPFEETPDGECTIHRNAKGEYFLCVPVKLKVQVQGGLEVTEKPIVSIDPGVRKFMTTYSPNGESIMFGVDFRSRILKVLKHIDSVNSAIATRTGTVKYLKRKKRSLYEDYKNLRDEFHWKIANFLTKRYSTIVTGKLCPQRMSSKLRTKTNRDMYAQSHWMFIERLRFKCHERQVPLLVVQEHHTSKTCGCCGVLNDVGGLEVYKCPACGYVADRDVNGARNILLKHISSRVSSTGV